MNRADRRRNGIKAVKNGQDTPTAPPAPQMFGLVAHGALEQTTPDGVKVKALVFRCVDQTGAMLVENTPNGPQPVLIVSQPIAVGRAVVLPGGAVPRA
jgi:hypothetical protein